ncbi:dihydrofolate reductase family protein [Gottschalkia acidurici 9a]|uniref:Dihydrofolate reductase family protein n=1 Tax=Gottschalkia acidurici (strain ATCC 7906 / DSM 604 / BCRC 14475 / CIP 104303 / KCTC 5404 / NCIMB 10678 / 9a) TaxID=1128398 RepID=K0AW42_GOTA9|nr:dihydrofolate reductase family protein [Gottschalkia acidurici]AFS77454.1 dihydrofolate reductase family protein [Gottschalkia acidurici 9a]
MSRNIVLYIAASLDGYIARSNGSIDWLSGDSDNDNTDNGYDKFYSTVDTIVMGRTTYDQVINELSPDIWVYEGKKCYVATTKKYEPDNNVEFISENITEFIKNLKKQQGKDIWLVGGGKLIDQFIKQDLIDKYIISIIPTILGDGIPLFLRNNPQIKLKLIETKNINGIVELTYVKND